MASDKLNGRAGLPSGSKSKPSKSKSAADPILAPVLALQKELAGSTDLNPLQRLIELCVKLSKSACSHSNASSKGKSPALPPDEHASTLKAIHISIQVLQRSFVALLKSDRVRLSNEVDERGCIAAKGSAQGATADEVVASWLQGRWDAFVALLCSLLSFESSHADAANEKIRSEALDCLKSLQVEASASLSRQKRPTDDTDSAPELIWALSPWKPLLAALIGGPTPVAELHLHNDAAIRTSLGHLGGQVFQDVRQKFVDDLLESYDDARFAALRELSSFLRSPPPHAEASKVLRSNALSLLVLLTAVPTQDADLNAFLLPEFTSIRKTTPGQSAKDKKRKFTEDGDSDDGADDQVVDWFSDSDEEGSRESTKKVKVTTKEKSSAAPGNAAVRSRKNRRRRAGLPFAQAVLSLSQQKLAFSNAWLALLLSPQSGSDGSAIGGELSLAQTHEVLLRLHIQILPHLVKPNMLLDWLVDCIDAGGATSLLALNGLFTVMVHHNLDYPAFYTKLYALLGSVETGTDGKANIVPSVLHMRYRSRFLRLLETFLSSTHLPSTLVASFAKRLSRLALRAPPAAAVTLVPFIWTLLKRHPQCMQLIHRNFTSSSTLAVRANAAEVDRFAAGPAGVADPFDPRETDPTATGAIDSSLWELASLGASLAAAQNAGRDPLSDKFTGGQSHWLHSVATLSRILAEPFTRDRYDLEDFLDITYATLFETETAPILKPNEKRKNPPPTPALAYSLPSSHLKGSKTYRAFVTASALARATELEAQPDSDAQPGLSDAASTSDPMDLWLF